MNIDDLTLGQIKELQQLLIVQNAENKQHSMLGKKVIIRTYSAGVWFGELSEKSGKEVILKNARRMWRWFASESISLSAVAIHGIKHDKSKICEAVKAVWVEAIEIIPCTNEAIISIEGADNAKPE